MSIFVEKNNAAILYLIAALPVNAFLNISSYGHAPYSRSLMHHLHLFFQAFPSDFQDTRKNGTQSFLSALHKLFLKYTYG